jgi:hypothetical protein
MGMTRQKTPQPKGPPPTLVSIQRDNVNALEQWVKFATGERNLSGRDIGELMFSTLRRFGRRVPDAPAIEELRRWLLSGFNKIVDEGEWVIPSRELGDFSIVIGRTGTAYEEHSAEGRALPGLTLAKLLNEESWRLARCAWCGKLFMKRKRGEYCGPKCSQTRQTFKARNPERWDAVMKAAEKAKLPIALWILQRLKKPERLVCTCPSCEFNFEVQSLLTWVQCPGCKGGFLAGPLNTESAAAIRPRPKGK